MALPYLRGASEGVLTVNPYTALIQDMLMGRIKKNPTLGNFYSAKPLQTSVPVPGDQSARPLPANTAKPLSDADSAATFAGMTKDDMTPEVAQRIAQLPSSEINKIPIELRTAAFTEQNRAFGSAGIEIGQQMFEGFKGYSMSNGNPLLHGGTTTYRLADDPYNTGTKQLSIPNPLAQSIAFTMAVNAGRVNAGDFFGGRQLEEAKKRGESYYTYDVADQMLKKLISENPVLAKDDFVDPHSRDAVIIKNQEADKKIADLNLGLKSLSENVDASGKTIGTNARAGVQAQIDQLEQEKRARAQASQGRYRGNYGYEVLNGLGAINLTPTTSNLQIKETIK